MVLKKDPRPINIIGNAAPNTLAQALWDYRKTHTQAEVDSFVSKIRIYENGAQGAEGAWILYNFPKMHWVRSNWQTYAYMGGGDNWQGEKGPYCWEPYPNTDSGQHKWTAEHVQNNHGALGKLYPDRYNGSYFIEGGGTAPWIGLVQRGIYDPDHQDWGGWGGRYSKEKKLNVWSRHGQVKPIEKDKFTPFYCYTEVADTWKDPIYGKTYTSINTPVFRWRRHMLNDFRARMDWCIKSYADANHHPVAAVGGDTTNSVIYRNAGQGKPLTLDASASMDPDDDQLRYNWYVYKEVGTYTGTVAIQNATSASATFGIPDNSAGKDFHVILEVSDTSNIIPLYDYRRIIVSITEQTCLTQK